MNVEIAEQKKGNFETPEQLAQALDAKNKALADKIREFGKKQITGESQDWRESLREELSASEEREIRDAIDDSHIDATFNEGLTPEEKQKSQIDAAVTAVAPWAVPLLNSGKKVEWFFKNISKSWDKAGDLWNQWEYLEAIKVFFLGLFGKFIDTDKEGEKTQTTSNDTLKVSQNIWYQAALKVILGFTPEKDEKTFDIMNLPQISKKKFSDLKSLQEKDIVKTLGIHWDSIQDKDVFQSVQVLLKKENQIDELLGKEHKNWRQEYSIIEICTILGPIMKPIEAFQKLDYKDFANSEMKFWEFDIKQPSDLTEKFETLRNQRWSMFEWVSKDLISQLLLSPLTNDEVNKQLLLNTFTEEKDRAFIENFSQFRNNMIWGIKADFFLWKEDQRQDFDAKFSQITPRHTLELMILTGGKTKKSEMNSFEQTSVYLKLWSILWAGKLRWETYDYALLQWSLKEWSEFADKIPQPLKDSVKMIAKKSFETWITALWNTVKELFGMLTTDQQITLWIFSGAALAVLWYMGPLRTAMWWAIIWASGLALASVAAKAYANEPEKFKEKFWNSTPEEIAEKWEDEIKKALES